MTQGVLFDAGSSLTCAFGTPWPHTSCPGCEGFAAELQAKFRAAVASGKFTEDGYTKGELSTARSRTRRRDSAGLKSTGGLSATERP